MDEPRISVRRRVDRPRDGALPCETACSSGPLVHSDVTETPGRAGPPRGRPPQGRVPRRARPRAAQPAGPDPQLAAPDEAARRARRARRRESTRPSGRWPSGRWRHLARLVDDLMDVSRISRGKIELRKEPVELAAVVRAGRRGGPVADRASGATTCSVDLPAGPIRLEADPTRLEQVFGNLLNNAAKYTEPGGPDPALGEREGGEAVVRVRDTGIGIAPEMLPKVFEMFVQDGEPPGPRAGRPGDRPEPGQEPGRAARRPDLGPERRAGPRQRVRRPPAPADDRRRAEPPGRRERPTRPARRAAAPPRPGRRRQRGRRPEPGQAAVAALRPGGPRRPRRPLGARAGRASSAPRSSCSTSACPGWTATRSPGGSAPAPSRRDAASWP